VRRAAKNREERVKTLREVCTWQDCAMVCNRFWDEAGGGRMKVEATVARRLPRVF